MPAYEDNMFFETMDVFTIFTVYINFQIMAESSDDLIFFYCRKKTSTFKFIIVSFDSCTR